MRIVADANVIISAIITPTGISSQIFDRWRRGGIALLVSEAILVEYQRVLGYPHIRRRHTMSGMEIIDLIDQFRQNGEPIEITQHFSVIAADPSDDIYLECAVAGEADCLVSGDTHLLALRKYAGIPILPPRSFLTLLDQALV